MAIFVMIKRWIINSFIGIDMPTIRIPIKGWMTIPHKPYHLAMAHFLNSFKACQRRSSSRWGLLSEQRPQASFHVYMVNEQVGHRWELGSSRSVSIQMQNEIRHLTD